MMIRITSKTKMLTPLIMMVMTMIKRTIFTIKMITMMIITIMMETIFIMMMIMMITMFTMMTVTMIMGNDDNAHDVHIDKHCYNNYKNDEDVAHCNGNGDDDDDTNINEAKHYNYKCS